MIQAVDPQYHQKMVVTLHSEGGFIPRITEKLTPLSIVSLIVARQQATLIQHVLIHVILPSFDTCTRLIPHCSKLLPCLQNSTTESTRHILLCSLSEPLTATHWTFTDASRVCSAVCWLMQSGAVEVAVSTEPVLLTIGVDWFDDQAR